MVESSSDDEAAGLEAPHRPNHRQHVPPLMAVPPGVEPARRETLRQLGDHERIPSHAAE